MRVLIVKLSALGDVIHALPVLDYLHQVVPGIAIDWVVDEGSRPVLEGHPLLRRVLVARTRAWRRHPLAAATFRETAALRQALREARYDIAFDLQGNLKSGVVTWLSGAGRRVGFDRDGVRERPNLWFTTEKVALRQQDYHVSARSLRVVSAAFGRDPADLTIATDIFTPAPAIARAGALLPSAPGAQVLLFHAGTTWATKLWHVQGWIELGRRARTRFPQGVVLLSWGNEAEKAVAEGIAAGVGEGCRVLPRLTLKELCALLRQVDVVVGGDTGPVHMAAAVGTPTVSFYRATDGRRNGPRGDRHRLIQAPLDCTACLRKQCPQDAACRASIPPEQVLAQLESLLCPREPDAHR